MTIDHFLYVVLLGQVLVLSLYVPSRILRRARVLIETHPPSEFPKLYPVPVATIERMLRVYRIVNLGFVVLGLALLAAAWLYGYTIDPAWQGGDVPTPNPLPIALVYTVLQMLPTVLFGLLEFLYFKRMRAAAHARIRTAELKPRRFFDFASPVLLGTAVAVYAVVAAWLLFAGELPRGAIAMAGLEISWRTYMFAALTVCHVVVAGCLVWALYGKKLDPHQTHEDRARMIQSWWRHMLIGSILLSAYFGIVIVLLKLRLPHYVPLLISLFLQGTGVLLTGKFCIVTPFGQESFEGYRAAVNRATATAIATDK
jgi:hypothetical protein